MLKITVLSPTGTVFEGEVHHVVFPGSAGSFEVYPSHAPLISSLKKGEIVCFLTETESKTIPVKSGFTEIKFDVITVCVEV
ncbi:MAG: F0F1 ATP synthase subunit epsilon [Tannerella sp.]|jgi:F-type H+-transporting ATPase subunit epsilon|nr:F0F1 ATP synthase subunit epsilon [Tannerella sp.]